MTVSHTRNNACIQRRPPSSFAVSQSMEGAIDRSDRRGGGERERGPAVDQTDRRASAARLSLRIGGGRGRGASASIRVSEGQSRLGGRKARRERGMAKGFSPRCRRRAAATSNAACGCLILMAAFIVNLLGSDAATASASAAAAGERSPRRGR